MISITSALQVKIYPNFKERVGIKYMKHIIINVLKKISRNIFIYRHLSKDNGDLFKYITLRDNMIYCYFFNL